MLCGDHRVGDHATWAFEHHCLAFAGSIQAWQCLDRQLLGGADHDLFVECLITCTQPGSDLVERFLCHHALLDLVHFLEVGGQSDFA